jgi:hypothetical protein
MANTSDLTLSGQDPPPYAITRGEKVETLVKSPVFILSTPRSGSTLLRVLLNSHPLIHAPHELHLTYLTVGMTAPFAELSMKLLGFGSNDLEHMLWDRLLHHELTRSGKQVIVEKGPLNVLRWERLHEAWPDARFIFLTRHPGAIYASIEERRAKNPDIELREVPDSKDYADSHAATVKLVASSPISTVEGLVARIERIEEARRGLAGITIRYEDLVSDAEHVTGEVCDFLDLPWDARMLDYGANDHGPLIRGIGDNGEKIKSGHIAAPRLAPEAEDVPAGLIPACRTWGYL